MQKKIFDFWNKYKLWLKAAFVVLLAGGLGYGTVEYMDTQIKPVEAKTPADVKQVLAAREKSGCQNAEYFVNLNILLRGINNQDLFFAVLRGMRFENGKVVYPQVTEQPRDLVAVKNFFDKMNITTAEELEQCVKFARYAQNYKETQVVMFMSSSAGK